MHGNSEPATHTAPTSRLSRPGPDGPAALGTSRAWPPETRAGDASKAAACSSVPGAARAVPTCCRVGERAFTAPASPSRPVQSFRTFRVPRRPRGTTCLHVIRPIQTQRVPRPNTRPRRYPSRAERANQPNRLHSISLRREKNLLLLFFRLLLEENKISKKSVVSDELRAKEDTIMTETIMMRISG